MRYLKFSVPAIFTVAAALVVLPVSSSTLSAKPVPMKIKAFVELFTSQGCSSCPPADKLLKSYIERKDVIALTMPVDYWDYLGWKDTFASPRNTQRQRDYAIARGDGNVYTPQVVVNGVAHAVGSRKGQIDDVIERTSNAIENLKTPISIWAENGTLIIEVGDSASAAKAKGATIWLATVRKKAPVAIRRGENAGEKVNYYNVVKDLSSVGEWQGKRMTVRLAKHAIMHGKASGCIVFLQQGKAGPIIGAAELKDW